MSEKYVTVLYKIPISCNTLPMTVKDLKETADLAHLQFSEDELEAALGAFEQMLASFAAMQAADEDEAIFPPGFIASSSHLSGSTGISRQVELSNSLNNNNHYSNFKNININPPSGNNENLLNNAGERDGRFLVIPNVL